MASINTNFSAMSALQMLRGIDSNLASTQDHISSGYRVNNASDNAAYWSIATTMRTDSDALSTVSEALGLGAAKLDTAYSGMDASIKIMSTIRSKLLAASEPNVDKDKINSEITELKNQLSTISQSSSFSGENWLYNSSTTAPAVKQMVGGFTRSSTGTVAVQTIDYDTSKSVLIDTKSASRGLLTKSVTVTQPSGTTTNTATYFLIAMPAGATAATGTAISITSATSDDNIEGMISAIDATMKLMTDAAAQLGAVNSRVSSQGSFVSNLKDTINKGVSRLVDADMNEESTRLKALQTQQQLGIQALSIANSVAQNVLQLFR